MDTIQPFKVCNKCEEAKSLDEFYKHPRSKDGLTYSCKECQKDYVRLYRAQNLEKVQAKDRRYRESGRRKDYQPTDRPKRVKQTLEEVTQAKRLWRKNNPNSILATRLRRQERLLNNAVYTVEEWQMMCDFFGNICLRCGSNEKPTIDHVISVYLGGTESLSNIQPLCGRCNYSKSWKKIIDYRDPKKLASFLLMIQRQRYK